MYSYKGKLNDLKEALIVLSWPKEALFKDGCLRAFISTDPNMPLLELLNHYKHRCPIEIFFRARSQLEAEKITYIYEKAQAGEPINAILEIFNAAQGSL